MSSIFSRRRFRFSLRNLFWLSTLTCVTLALWTAGKDRVIADVQKANEGWPPSVIAPYLLKISQSDNVTEKDSYHFWFCGLTAKLPYAAERPEPNPVYITVRPRIIVQYEDEIPQVGFDVRAR